MVTISLSSSTIKSIETVKLLCPSFDSKIRFRRRALESFLPIFQSHQPSNVHIPSNADTNDPRQSFAIKRRHMTFAQAEHERAERIIQLALLSAGDVIGLECYVCDLATHINSARCTAPCDLFYILKHNFTRLQKRHGTQGLGERLREMVLLSLQAYPSRIMYMPLFTALMKKKLAPRMNDDQLQQQQQQQYQNRQPWLVQMHNSSQRVRSLRSFFSHFHYIKFSSEYIDQTPPQRPLRQLRKNVH